jgi:hypothetical protein
MRAAAALPPVGRLSACPAADLLLWDRWQEALEGSHVVDVLGESGGHPVVKRPRDDRTCRKGRLGCIGVSWVAAEPLELRVRSVLLLVLRSVLWAVLRSVLSSVVSSVVSAALGAAIDAVLSGELLVTERVQRRERTRK